MRKSEAIIKLASTLLACQLAFVGAVGTPMTVFAASVGTTTKHSTEKKAADTTTTTKENTTTKKSDEVKQNKETTSEKTLKEREAELNKREKELDKREDELNEREKELDKREKELSTESETNKSTSSTGKLIEGVNLTRIGTAGNDHVQAVVNGFNALPTKMQDKILAGGYKFEVTSEDIEKLLTGGGTNSWYGATAGTPLFVTLIGTNQTLAEMTRTTIHECGHALDNSLGIITNLPDFQAIYAAEGKTMYKTADVHDASEWFSECCVYYIQSPAILKHTAPLSYNYMENLFKNVLK